MDLNSIRELLKIFDGSNTAELSWEEDNFKIYLSKNTPNAAPQQVYQMPVTPQAIASFPHTTASPLQLKQQDENQSLMQIQKTYECASPIVNILQGAVA